MYALLDGLLSRLNVEFWIVVGLIVLGTFIILTILARLYRKVGPNQALIVYGLGGTRVYSGRGALVWPMIQVLMKPP